MSLQGVTVGGERKEAEDDLTSFFRNILAEEGLFDEDVSSYVTQLRDNLIKSSEQLLRLHPDMIPRLNLPIALENGILTKKDEYDMLMLHNGSPLRHSGYSGGSSEGDEHTSHRRDRDHHSSSKHHKTIRYDGSFSILTSTNTSHGFDVQDASSDESKREGSDKLFRRNSVVTHPLTCSSVNSSSNSGDVPEEEANEECEKPEKQEAEIPPLYVSKCELGWSRMRAMGAWDHEKEQKEGDRLANGAKSETFAGASFETSGRRSLTGSVASQPDPVSIELLSDVISPTTPHRTSTDPFQDLIASRTRSSSDLAELLIQPTARDLSVFRAETTPQSRRTNSKVSTNFSEPKRSSHSLHSSSTWPKTEAMERSLPLKTSTMQAAAEGEEKRPRETSATESVTAPPPFLKTANKVESREVSQFWGLLPSSKDHIRRTWELLNSQPADRVVLFYERLYDRFVDRDPIARHIFHTGGNRPPKAALIRTISFLLESFHRPEAVHNCIHRLAIIHRIMNIRETNCATFQEIFVKTLAEMLGHDNVPLEAKEAWVGLFQKIITLMINEYSQVEIGSVVGECQLKTHCGWKPYLATITYNTIRLFKIDNYSELKKTIELVHYGEVKECDTDKSKGYRFSLTSLAGKTLYLSVKTFEERQLWLEDLELRLRILKYVRLGNEHKIAEDKIRAQFVHHYDSDDLTSMGD